MTVEGRTLIVSTGELVDLKGASIDLLGQDLEAFVAENNCFALS